MAKNPVRVEMRMDMNKLNAMIEHSVVVADACSLDAANQMVSHIKANWSPTVPSSPGNPPAVDTGELERSIAITRKGLLSRLVSRNAYTVTANAEYAAALEFGKVNAPNTILPRPYMRPAVEAVKKDFRRTFFPIINPRTPAYSRGSSGGGSVTGLMGFSGGDGWLGNNNAGIGELISIAGAIMTGVVIGYNAGDDMGDG